MLDTGSMLLFCSLVFYLCVFCFRLDPYTKLARLTGMARLCEVFFRVFLWFRLLVFGPRSVTQSVNPSVWPRQSTRLPSLPAQALDVSTLFLMARCSLKQACAIKDKPGCWAL